MAMMITADCINCAACEPDCPNEAISAGDDAYVVEAGKCTECVGAYDEPKCLEACPIDGCITKDPKAPETREDLQAKYAKLHGSN